MAVTFAFGTAALDESVTVPLRVAPPISAWPNAAAATRQAQRTIRKKVFSVSIRLVYRDHPNFVPKFLFQFGVDRSWLLFLKVPPLRLQPEASPVADMEDVHRVLLNTEQDTAETARFPETSYIARGNARATGWPVPN